MCCRQQRALGGRSCAACAAAATAPSSRQMPAPLRGTPDGGRAAAAGDAAAAAAEAAAGVERWRRGAREMAPVLLRAGGGAWKVADRLHGLEEKCDARCERSCVGPRRIDVRKLLNGRHQVVTRIFSA